MHEHMYDDEELDVITGVIQAKVREGESGGEGGERGRERGGGAGGRAKGRGEKTHSCLICLSRCGRSGGVRLNSYPMAVLVIRHGGVQRMCVICTLWHATVAAIDSIMALWYLPIASSHFGLTPKQETRRPWARTKFVIAISLWRNICCLRTTWWHKSCC